MSKTLPEGMGDPEYKMVMERKQRRLAESRVINFDKAVNQEQIVLPEPIRYTELESDVIEENDIENDADEEVNEKGVDKKFEVKKKSMKKIDKRIKEVKKEKDKKLKGRGMSFFKSKKFKK